MKTIDITKSTNPLDTSTDIEILMESPSHRVPSKIRNAPVDVQFEWETKPKTRRDFVFPEPKFKIQSVKRMKPMNLRVLNEPERNPWIQADYSNLGSYALPRLA
jgi:hypothetical protein